MSDNIIEGVCPKRGKPHLIIAHYYKNDKAGLEGYTHSCQACGLEFMEQEE